jgi:two-component system, sensor histidine kinase and response regulator
MSAPERAHVLIVDDTPENIQVLMETLRHEYSLAAATSGERALALATGKKMPDIILLDVMMPGIDGYETCRRLKADEKTAAIPVLFITAMSQTTDEAQGLALGAVDYVTKPFSPELVKARLANHLSLYRARQELLRKNYESVRANAQLKRQNELMREVMGCTVHGLRNQLMVISGFVQLVGILNERDAETPVKRRTMLEKVKDTVAAMSEGISGILTLESLESTSVELDLRPTELAPLIDSVCDLNQAHATSKQITILRDLPSTVIAAID